MKIKASLFLLILSLTGMASYFRAPTSLEAKNSRPETTGSSSREAPAQALDELLLFYPSKYPNGNWRPDGLVYEDVWFKAKDGTRLHGWYCPCEKARATVLFAHGNGGNLAFAAPLLQYLQKDLRVTVLIFDYRGYGRSEGVPTVEGVLDDARAARALLAKRAGLKESEIVLMGHSLGGAIAVQLVAETPARGLILMSTFSSLADVATHHFGRLGRLVPANRLDSVSAIRRYHGPLLQSHGDSDRTIPYALGVKLFEAANGPKRFVRVWGGDHDGGGSKEWYEAVEGLIEELAGGAR